jgi:predicted small lipoprotein YifL
MAYSVSALEALNPSMNRNKISPLRAVTAMVLSACLALCMTGCGQRGPLYLPEEEQTGQEAPTQPVPEEEQEEDDEENS